MNNKETEDQSMLNYTIDRLYSRYDSPEDLIKIWILFGPCIERCPKPEIRSPWTLGLDVLP